jgi:hypothetical protein
MAITDHMLWCAGTRLKGVVRAREAFPSRPNAESKEGAQ